MFSRLDPKGRTSARDGLYIFVTCFALAMILLRLGEARIPRALMVILLAPLAVVMGLNGWRRAHDLGFPGGFGLVPLLFPGLVLLGFWNPKLWMALALAWPLLAISIWVGWEASRDGEPRPNRYGPDPLGRTPRGLSEKGNAVSAKLRRRAKPSLRLIEAVSPSFSKLGGAPDLPDDGVTWPHWKTHPHEFLAQFDLSEVRAAGGPDWLPGHGRIWVFFNTEQGLDYSLEVGESFELIHHPTPLSDRSFLQPPSPQILYPERRVSFLTAKSYPAFERLGDEADGLDSEDIEELSAPLQSGEGPKHQIGGYASPIQTDDMELTCELMSRRLDPEWGKTAVTPKDHPAWKAAQDWRLLMQIDSDDELGMNWIDSGMLYFWIRQQDARAGDFSKVRLVVQFY